MAEAEPQFLREKATRFRRLAREIVDARAPHREGCQKHRCPRRGRLGAFEVWFQDEARVGQQGTVTRIWARRGSRPRAKKDLGLSVRRCLPGTRRWRRHCHAGGQHRRHERTPRSHQPCGLGGGYRSDGPRWRQLACLAASEAAGQHRVAAPAALCARTQSHREHLGVPARQFTQPSGWNGYPAIVDACCRAWNTLMAMPHVLRSITHREYAKVRI